MAILDKLKRIYGSLCVYCNTYEADSIDHIIPKSKRGSNTIQNLLPACCDCNSKKSSINITSWSKNCLEFRKNLNNIIKTRETHSEYFSQAAKDTIEAIKRNDVLKKINKQDLKKHRKKVRRKTFAASIDFTEVIDLNELFVVNSAEFRNEDIQPKPIKLKRSLTYYVSKIKNYETILNSFLSKETLTKSQRKNVNLIKSKMASYKVLLKNNGYQDYNNVDIGNSEAITNTNVN